MQQASQAQVLSVFIATRNLNRDQGHMVTAGEDNVPEGILDKNIHKIFDSHITQLYANFISLNDLSQCPFVDYFRDETNFQISMNQLRVT